MSKNAKKKETINRTSLMKEQISCAAMWSVCFTCFYCSSTNIKSLQRQEESIFLHKMCVKLWSKFDFVSVTSLLSFNDIHSKFVTAENRACAFSHFA